MIQGNIWISIYTLLAIDVVMLVTILYLLYKMYVIDPVDEEMLNHKKIKNEQLN